jgi:hypothetical protein
VPPEVILSFRRELAGARREIAEAQGRHRAVVKRAKSEGVNVKAMSEVISNHALDQDEVTRHYRDVFRYGTITGAAYATQTDMFGDAGVDTDVKDSAAIEQREWEAGEAGYAAGKGGVPIDNCPHVAGSPLNQIWCKRWHAGQAAIAGEMGPDETSPVGRSRGGRGRGRRGGVNGAEAHPAA